MIRRLRGNQYSEQGETPRRIISGGEKHRLGDVMGEYEDILKDIEETFGIVPGFYESTPSRGACARLAVVEEVQLGADGHSRQVSRAGRIGSRSKHKVPVLSVDAYGNGPVPRRDAGRAR